MGGLLRLWRNRKPRLKKKQNKRHETQLAASHFLCRIYDMRVTRTDNAA